MARPKVRDAMYLALVWLSAAPGAASAPRARHVRASYPEQTVLVVTSTEDTEDVQWGDGACGDTLGRCTLRGAIQEANAHDGADTIRFRIASGVQVIKPKSALPVIFDETVLDASTQQGFAGTPLIQLDGSDAGTGADGVVMAGDSSLVKGLAVTGFDGIGVVVSDSEESRLEGSYVGLSPDGRTAAGNKGHGVHLIRARRAVIGGTDVAKRNVISGNGGNGVHITEVGARDNQVVGNFIGVDAAGVTPVPNRVDGVSIENAGGNRVGGGAAGEVNLIAGNGDDGVEIVGPGSVSNTVQANWIGSAVDGASPLGNGDSGILVAGATGNQVIGNVVVASRGFGVELTGGARGNRIVANYAGSNPTGTGMANSAGGIGILDAADNEVGESGLPNRIASNSGPGVLVAGTRARGNIIAGNEIGALAGEALPNGGYGVVIRDGAGANSVDGNTVHDGIRVWEPGSDLNQLVGNLVASPPNPLELDIGIEVGLGPAGTLVSANVVTGTTGAAVLVHGRGTVRTEIVGTTAEPARGAGIVVDSLAGPVAIRRGAPAGSLKCATGPAVELAGYGHVVAGVVVQGCAIGVALSGTGHMVEDLTSLGGNGPAVAVLEGSGHTVARLRTGDATGPVQIDLGGDGASPNDELDADAGPNGLLNHPVLGRVLVTGTDGDGAEVSAEVDFAGAPDTGVRLEVYAVRACAPGGHAVDVEPVPSSATLHTGADGIARTTVTGLRVPVTSGGLASTATGADGSTSELSPCVTIAQGRVLLPSLTR